MADFACKWEGGGDATSFRPMAQLSQFWDDKASQQPIGTTRVAKQATTSLKVREKRIRVKSD